MDLQALKQSLGADAPPAGLDEALQALWHQGKGDWQAAHEHAQKAGDEAGAWVHAHLHRVEGDQSNAGHWYRRAGRQASTLPLDAEWDEIAAALLART
jgi:hypothetical protein